MGGHSRETDSNATRLPKVAISFDGAVVADTVSGPKRRERFCGAVVSDGSEVIEHHKLAPWAILCGRFSAGPRKSGHESGFETIADPSERVRAYAGER